jgi:V/A-type H+-transporting ATPase subunit A
LIRTEFLQQNAYSDDAFSPPEKTLAIIKRLLDLHESVGALLKQGMPLEEALKVKGTEAGKTS